MRNSIKRRTFTTIEITALYASQVPEISTSQVSHCKKTTKVIEPPKSSCEHFKYKHEAQ